MRKREMNEEQLEIRERIIVRLKRAGWKEGAALSGFEDGDFVLEEAVMEFRGKMDLTFSYSATEGMLTLAMEVKLGRGVTIVMKCFEALEKVIDIIVSFQRNVSESNFQDYIVAIVDICPEVYADRGDEGLVRLDNSVPRKNKP
jgi:hypothetical protein